MNTVCDDCNSRSVPGVEFASARLLQRLAKLLLPDRGHAAGPGLVLCDSVDDYHLMFFFRLHQVLPFLCVLFI